MSKNKVLRIIANGVPHRLVNIEDSIYKQISDVCEYCSLRNECRRVGEDEEENSTRYLCGMSNIQNNANTLFIVDTESLDKTIRELLNESIEA